MPNFKVSILKGQDMKEIGSFTYNHTILQLKQYYYDKIDNSVPVNQLRFQYSVEEMKNDKTLGYYDDDVGYFGMVIQYLVRRDGGGMCAPAVGPDIDSKVHEQSWSGLAPDYRVLEPGFSIEWKYNGKYVIGNLGDGTFVMNRTKHLKKAYCKHFKIYFDGQLKNITEYYFNNCTATFEGEYTDGETFNKIQKFGNKACKFEGKKKKYNYLEIKVVI